MRSLILSVLLGIGALGTSLLMPADAEAQVRRARTSSSYFWPGNYYYGPQTGMYFGQVDSTTPPRYIVPTYRYETQYYQPVPSYSYSPSGYYYSTPTYPVYPYGYTTSYSTYTYPGYYYWR